MRMAHTNLNFDDWKNLAFQMTFEPIHVYATQPKSMTVMYNNGLLTTWGPITETQYRFDIPCRQDYQFNGVECTLIEHTIATSAVGAIRAPVIVPETETFDLNNWIVSFWVYVVFEGH